MPCLNMLCTAYNLGLQSGNMDNCKAAADNVRRAVKEAKRDYGLWLGLRTMTDYKFPPGSSQNSRTRD